VQSAGSALPLAQAGKIRIIGIAGPQRLTGALASVPTLREQGVDVIAPVFYVIFGPTGMDTEQRAFWDQALSAAMQSEQIRKDVDRNSWTVGLIGHRELPAFLEKEYQNYRRALTDMGMVK
jgi:putative tricarboxylic transport membrane protein